jgi:hypothetical protein
MASLGLREIEYVVGKTQKRDVDLKTTIAVGVSEAVMRNALDIIDRDYNRNGIAEINGSHAHITSVGSALFLIDGALIERTNPRYEQCPPYSLRLIVEAVEGGSLERLRSVATRLGLPVPSQLRKTSSFYDLSTS